MNRIKFNHYSGLTNDQLIDMTIAEMDKLKILSLAEDMEEYEKGASLVNQLLIEIKRRDISLNSQRLSRRILL